MPLVSFHSDVSPSDHERSPLTNGYKHNRDSDGHLLYHATAQRESAARFRRQEAQLLQLSRRSNYKISSLDFERVINRYSIQAMQQSTRIEGDTSIRHSNNNKASRLDAFFGRSERTASSQRSYLEGYTGRTATRWILTALAGLLTGLTSILLVGITGGIVDWRARILHNAVATSTANPLVVFHMFAWTNLALALLSSLLCVAWVPSAAGSGIPEVKAYLNGIRSLQKLVHLPLFVVKIVGTILSVSSGHSVGQEGPLIHIGAIMGAACTKIGGQISRLLIHINEQKNKQEHYRRRHHGRNPKKRKWWCWPFANSKQARHHHIKKPWTEKMLSWTMTELSHFATDAERRDLVSIGASVGFAASFGAPIGGLLFILDDVSSYFHRDLLLRMLVANAIGTFCLAVQHGDLSNYSVINMGTYDTPNDNIFVNRLEEIPLYILIGVGGGILGGLFCAGFLFLRTHITSKFPTDSKGKWQLAEVALVSILTSIVVFYLPTVKWACVNIADIAELNGGDINIAPKKTTMLMKSVQHNRRFFCQPGQINEMATIMFGSRIEAIREILTDPSQYQKKTLIAIGFSFYFLTLITFGSAIPSGIFTPTVLVGAALGGAAGNTFHEYIDPEISPSTFALLGVAGLLAGTQRSTVSVAVILVEGTGQIKVLSPVIIVVVIARYVAQMIHTLGVFETAMAYKQYPYLPHEENKRYYDSLKVSDVMSAPPVETLNPQEQVGDLVSLLMVSTHHGFPVVEPTTKRFLGLVRREQIAALLECGVFSYHKQRQCESDIAAASCGIQCDETCVNEAAPLMHWAYHINDDRYDHIIAIPSEEPPPTLLTGSLTGGSCRGSTSNFGSNIGSASIEEAEIEDDDIKDFFGEDDHGAFLLTREQREVNKSIKTSLMDCRVRSSSLSEIPKDFATVTQNDAGNVVVSWHNPEFEDYWVDLEAVANTGAYTVSEFCPVSKAYTMFTGLGLRHIIVLGGSSGGEVVGVLTRASFLPGRIQQQAGL